MREVLKLEYDATSRAILVTVSATKESEHVPGVMVRQLGMPDPTSWIPIDTLPEPHASSLTALLDALPDIVEADVAAKTSDPDALIAKASELAVEEARIAAARAELKAKQAEAADLDAKLAKLRADAASASHGAPNG